MACRVVFESDLDRLLVMAVVGNRANQALGYVRLNFSGERPASLDAQQTYMRTAEIADVTGIPRETVRRKAAALQLRGWLSATKSLGLGVTPVAARDLAEFTMDLAGIIREILPATAAVRSGIPARSMTDTVLRAEFPRVYADWVQRFVVILSTARRAAARDLDRLLLLLGVIQTGRKGLNAFSAAASLGIPAETARRKLEMMERSGWIKRSARSRRYLPAFTGLRIGRRLLNSVLAEIENFARHLVARSA